MNKFTLPARDDAGKLPAYAWPGGYPIYYVTEDGLTVCPTCANDETSDDVVAADVNYEDAALYCDDCNKRIESAYAEDDAMDDDADGEL